MIAKILLEKLKKDTSEISSVYFSLFSIFGAEDLEGTLSYIYDVYTGKEEGTDYGYNRADWFFAFHKGMRQTDFFSGCTKTWTESLLSDVENTEYDSLVASMNQQWKALTKEERAEKYIYTWFKDNQPDLYKRYLILKQKKVNKESRSIDGHLDSALWNLIHVDTKGVLGDVMERSFKKHTLELAEAEGNKEPLKKDSL